MRSVKPSGSQPWLLDRRRGNLQFFSLVTGKIGRVLARHGVETILPPPPPPDIAQILHPTKDDLKLRTAGIYCVPFECGISYAEQTGRTVAEWCKEHENSVHLKQPEKCALALQSLQTGHTFPYSSTIGPVWVLGNFWRQWNFSWMPISSKHWT